MIINLDIDLTMLPKAKITEGKNGHKYIKLTASTMKQPDKWGNDMTIYISQTREERGKVDRLFVGKGKTYNKEQERERQDNQPSGDMPF